MHKNAWYIHMYAPTYMYVKVRLTIMTCRFGIMYFYFFAWYHDVDDNIMRGNISWHLCAYMYACLYILLPKFFCEKLKKTKPTNRSTDITIILLEEELVWSVWWKLDGYCFLWFSTTIPPPIIVHKAGSDGGKGG